MSELTQAMSMTQVFDHSRMLDAQSYPAAYIVFGKYRLEFSRAKRTSQGVVADVLIPEEKK